MARRTPSEISMVFEPAWRTTPRPTTRRPSRRVKLLASSGENTTVATSATRMSPRTMIAPISSSVTTEASARTISSWSRDRKLPAGTSRGAWRRTAPTSVTVRP